jgi:lysophospholipase L1-like esterase
VQPADRSGGFIGMKFPRSLPLLAALITAQLACGQDAAIDWQRARELFQREQRGEKLNADDQKYLDEAKRQRARRGAERPERGPREPLRPVEHYTPLTELTGQYQGQDGGLYGGGRNDPPAELAASAAHEATVIKPLDKDGRPSDDGRVVLLSIGMSNTTQEFSTFKRLADADPRKSPALIIVDAAQGGRDAPAWSSAEAETWRVADQRLTAANVTPQQVQVAWIKQAIAGPRAGFPAGADRLREHLAEIVRLAKTRYPNLRLAFLSSRIYAGYARSRLNPEPYAYESAFAVRALIQKQMANDPSLNADATHGAVRAPLLLWGPYLWADGTTPRKSDGLFYAPEDLGPDGTHPSPTGREKVARQLLDFLTTNPYARPWFTRGS